MSLRKSLAQSPASPRKKNPFYSNNMKFSIGKMNTTDVRKLSFNRRNQALFNQKAKEEELKKKINTTMKCKAKPISIDFKDYKNYGPLDFSPPYAGASATFS